MYRTGRGSITMRGVVSVEELQGRTCLVITELPYQVNPDNLADKIATMVKEGRMSGIADIQDHSSGRTGQRLVIVLKRDAVPKVVLNNLYKHTELQQNFGANMLALVDGVPRTLALDGFISAWIEHQLEVIQRRTAYRLRKAEADAHILRGYLKALDMLDEVIALIRRSPTPDDARTGLIDLLDVDEVQANAILSLQLRRLAALERQRIIDQAAELERLIADYKDILAKVPRQRSIVAEELTEIVDRFGDDRRTQILPGYDGEMSIEDLIPEEEVVVTVTRGGYIKRTRTRPVPVAASRRPRRARRAAARRRHRRPPVRHLDPPLAARLHERRPGVPGEDVRGAGERTRREGAAHREPARDAARRAGRADPRHPRLHGRPLPGARDAGRPA